MKILIIGCGDIGTAVANRLIQEGYHVTAIKRTLPNKEDEINYIKADITNRETLKNIDQDFEQILYILSPDSNSETDYKAVFEIGLNNVLEHFSKSSFIFISSTVVHGQSGGEWVDEDTNMIAYNMRSKVLIKAEKALLSQHFDNTVIRFSGIYGRGGTYLLDKLKQNQVIQYQPPYFTNRIHRDDCIGVVLFILRKKFEGSLDDQIYIATDQNPITLYEVASLIAIENSFPKPLKKYLESNANQNKRLSCQRLIDLGYNFKYPSYNFNTN